MEGTPFYLNTQYIKEKMLGSHHVFLERFCRFKLQIARATTKDSGCLMHRRHVALEVVLSHECPVAKFAAEA